VQSILSSIDNLEGGTLVVGGDGRYFMDSAIEIICQMAAANGVSRLIIGQNGIFSTPSVSNLIRKHKAVGGIILTASHNPGGPDADFGIKYNCSNGGPAPSSTTDKIFAMSKQISSYKTCKQVKVDITKIGETVCETTLGTTVFSVVSSVADYVEMMKEIFDFDLIKKYVADESLSLLFDSLHGVMGPYSRAVVCDELQASPSSVVNAVPTPDFNGGHPDPNLTYAKELVDEMEKGRHDIGVAFDGDGDRNMIIGKNGFFVSPCDSLAVIAANCKLIPFFQKNQVTGFARSMPTSGAIDLVAKEMGVEMFETPTGWKFFGNLMDAGRMVLCGEESFGTGSSHIREKDGMWAALAWLSIMAGTGKGIEDVCKDHWLKYGRNCFTRYDYEQVDSASANQMMANLRKFIETGELCGETKTSGGRSYKIKLMDDFEYTDPIDGSVAKKQGVRIIFEDGSRIIFRLSGTGSSGATIRMYIDSYISPVDGALTDPASKVLEPLVSIALQLSEIEKLTGRTSPSVITPSSIRFGIEARFLL